MRDGEDHGVTSVAGNRNSKEDIVGEPGASE